jgi:hypothetical protein
MSTGEDAHLDGIARAGDPGQHRQEGALVRGGLHPCRRAGGFPGGGDQLAQDAVGPGAVPEQVVADDGVGDLHVRSRDGLRPGDLQVLAVGASSQVAGEDVPQAGQGCAIRGRRDHVQPAGRGEHAGPLAERDRRPSVGSVLHGGLLIQAGGEQAEITGWVLHGDRRGRERHGTPPG